MEKSVNIKVCGMTRESDIEHALSLGADYIGFIVYSKSPRAVKLEKAQALAKLVPKEKVVIVDVKPSTAALKSYKAAGFNRFQIHIDLPLDTETLEEYRTIVNRDQLWLAPRLAPSEPFPEQLLNYAGTILVDTYSKDTFGGTGHTGDFARFAELKKQFTNTDWVLAGGLNASNIADAIHQSTTSNVDVNSGVEKAPGVKDDRKLNDFFELLRKSLQHDFHSTTLGTET